MSLGFIFLTLSCKETSTETPIPETQHHIQTGGKDCASIGLAWDITRSREQLEIPTPSSKIIGDLIDVILEVSKRDLYFHFTFIINNSQQVPITVKFESLPIMPDKPSKEEFTNIYDQLKAVKEYEKEVKALKSKEAEIRRSNSDEKSRFLEEIEARYKKYIVDETKINTQTDIEGAINKLMEAHNCFDSMTPKISLIASDGISHAGNKIDVSYLKDKSVSTMLVYSCAEAQGDFLKQITYEKIPTINLAVLKINDLLN